MMKVYNKPMKLPTVGVVWVVLGLALSGQFFLAQQQAPWTLWVGIALMGSALWKLRELPFPVVGPSLDVRTEFTLFSMLFLIAVGAHFWRLGVFPAGLSMDLGEMGWCALRILHEGWRPLEETFQYPTPFLTDFYQLAAWFGLVGSSLLTLRLFFLLFSLAGFPLFYMVLRKWTDPGTALLALFFMAVMRWQWIEARSPHPSCETAFYLLALMALLLAGFQDRKPLCLAGAALVCGVGIYAYQNLKALPLLMAALWAFEYFRFPSNRTFLGRNWKGSLALFLALALPLLDYAWNHHNLGEREAGAFIGRKIIEEKKLSPLFGQLAGFALMFNRQGDLDPFHNLPGLRMLDDGTGFLFWMGLALAWRKRREREGAYPLIGFAVMALPGLLTADPYATQRYTGLLPFIAYFAALGGMGLWNGLAGTFLKWKEVRWALGLLFLCAAALENGYFYFGREARDSHCKEAYGPEQTFIGNEISAQEQKSPGRFRYFVDPFFEHNPTIAFLGYPARDRIIPFEASDWAQGKMPEERDLEIFLAGEKSGAWFFLQRLLPGGQTGIFRSPDGETGLYLDWVPVSTLKGKKPWDRGLKGVYLQSGNWNGPPVASRTDPLINFASREDFPFQGPPPYRARWLGGLQIGIPGGYEFNLLSSDKAQLWLDGKAVSPEKPVYLAKGFHALRLEYEKNSGYYMALHLAWKKPDGSDWEVVPAEAFGVIH